MYLVLNANISFYKRCDILISQSNSSSNTDMCTVCCKHFYGGHNNAGFIYILQFYYSNIYDIYASKTFCKDQIEKCCIELGTHKVQIAAFKRKNTAE